MLNCVNGVVVGPPMEILPVLGMRRMLLVPSAEELAMMKALLPESESPVLSEMASLPNGVVVPMPTTPPAVANSALPVEVSAVVDAYGNCDAMVELEKYEPPWS